MGIIEQAGVSIKRPDLDRCAVMAWDSMGRRASCDGACHIGSGALEPWRAHE
jgi:hypothetical protein